MNEQSGEELFLQGKIDESLPILKDEAENGNARAMYLLGTIYREGYGHVPADEETAVAWFQKGKEKGDALAAISLFGTSAGSDMWDLVNDYFGKVLLAANAGDVFAMDEAGRFLTEGGLIVKVDEGVKWFTKAAFYEYWRGLYDLGQAFEDGFGNGTEEKALACYKKAAEFHDKYSEYKVGAYYVDNADDRETADKGAAYLKNAYKDGSSEAALLLGRFYENGADGLMDADPHEAFHWYEKGAALGNGEAMAELAYYYDQGIVVKQDRKKAEDLYQKAIAAGNDDALFSLALLYLDEGKDESAFPCLLGAAKRDNPRAQFLLGSMYLYGKGVEENRAEAVDWLEEAAGNGDSDAEELLQKVIS